MEQSVIFEPVFVMLILTLLVWIYMFARRIPFITSSHFGPGELTPLSLQQRSPPEVSNPSDNLKNLFEIPVIFYFLSLYLFVTNQVDQVYLIASWLFVVFRVFHSIVHCTFNAVMLRFSLYLVATLSLWFIVLRAGLGLLS
jgi:hypothetical protein